MGEGGVSFTSTGVVSSLPKRRRERVSFCVVAMKGRLTPPKLSVVFSTMPNK